MKRTRSTKVRLWQISQLSTTWLIGRCIRRGRTKWGKWHCGMVVTNQNGVSWNWRRLNRCAPDYCQPKLMTQCSVVRICQPNYHLVVPEEEEDGFLFLEGHMPPLDQQMHPSNSTRWPPPHSRPISCRWRVGVWSIEGASTASTWHMWPPGVAGVARGQSRQPPARLSANWRRCAAGCWLPSLRCSPLCPPRSSTSYPHSPFEHCKVSLICKCGLSGLLLLQQVPFPLRLSCVRQLLERQPWAVSRPLSSLAMRVLYSPAGKLQEEEGAAKLRQKGEENDTGRPF